MSSPSKKNTLLPTISVTRPVTIIMCLIGLMVVGLVAYLRIPVQAWASGNDWNYFWVDVNDENASVQERFRTISLPLEQHMRTLRELSDIDTFAGNPWAGVQLRFHRGTNMRDAYSRASDRLERAKLELPSDVRDRIKIYSWNQETDSGVIWCGLSVPAHIPNKEQWAMTHVSGPIERIDGVAKTNIWGLRDKEVMILLDHERLKTHGIKTPELVFALKQDNFALSGGHVIEGGKRFFVRSLAHYSSLEDIENVQIRNLTSEHVIRLRDVADVKYGAAPEESIWRVDGKRNLGMEIYKESGQNIVDLCERIVAKMSEIEATTPAKFHLFYSEGKLINESMHNLQATAAWGGLFAALVLLFFLRALRMTVLITSSIPLCTLITVIVLYFLDWSLNLLTMMGLMVGVGMVVDNAIVIVENIYRLRVQGVNPHEASIQGASEVGLAITMATLTTVVVFLPLMLMNSSFDMKFLLSKIGMPVVFALVASLFVALLFIPLASAKLGGSKTKNDAKAISWTRTVYLKGLQWSLNHKRDTFLIICTLFATIYYPMHHIKQTDRMRFSSNQVTIRMWGPRNFTLEEMDGIASDIEAFINQRRNKYKIKNIMTYFRPGYVNVRMNLQDDPHQEWWYAVYRKIRTLSAHPLEKWMTRKEIIDEVSKEVPRFVGFRVAVESNRSGGGNDPYVSVYLFGPDHDRLEELLVETERRLQQIPSITSLESDLEFGNNEVRIRINRTLANQHGFSVEDISQTLAYQLRGTSLPRFHADDREIDVSLILDESDRQSLAQLKNYSFASKTGEQIPLLSFASLKIAKGPRHISRKNGRNRMRVRVYTTKDDLKGLYQEIDSVMKGSHYQGDTNGIKAKDIRNIVEKTMR